MTVEILTQQLVEFYDKLASWEHSVVKESSLTPSQMHAIEVIGGQQDLRMKELAERLGVTTGTLTVAVDKLEKLGLVSRVPHSSDRRSYYIILTDEGTQLFHEHHLFHRAFTAEITHELAAEELKTLSELLAKILQRM